MRRIFNRLKYDPPFWLPVALSIVVLMAVLLGMKWWTAPSAEEKAAYRTKLTAMQAELSKGNLEGAIVQVQDDGVHYGIVARMKPDEKGFIDIRFLERGYPPLLLIGYEEKPSPYLVNIQKVTRRGDVDYAAMRDRLLPLRQSEKAAGLFHGLGTLLDR